MATYTPPKLNTFARTSSKGGWSGSFNIPQYRPLSRITPIQPKKPGGVGGFFVNILKDARDFAYGLPMAGVQLGKSVGGAVQGDFSGFKKMGGDAWHSFEYTYSPLIKGNLGEFGKRVYEHPLAPILDAVAVPAMAFGGAGLAIKGASTVGLVSKTSRAVKAFEPKTRTLDAVWGAPKGYKHYSANPAIRVRQKGFEKAGDGLAKLVPNLFGTKKSALRDLTDVGRHERWLARNRSDREVATGTMFRRQMIAARHLFKDPKHTPEFIATQLDAHIRPLAYERAMKVNYDRMKRDKHGRPQLAEGWIFMRKNPGPLEFPKDTSPEEFSKWIKSYGKRITIDKPRQALRDGQGNYYVMRTKSLEDWLNEAANTHRALNALYKTPTKVWKWLVLATVPRFFVNNVVGNSILYAMSANPVATSKGFYHAIRDMYGEAAARQAAGEIDRAMRKVTGDWIDKWYLAATQGFGGDIAKELGNKYGKAGRAADIAKGGLYGATGFASDTVPRRMAINYLITRHPMYKEFFDYVRANTPGISRRDAHKETADLISAEPEVRDWVVEKVNDILGQYTHFTRGEKLLKSVVPFYGWDRAIMRHAWTMASERPVQAAIMVRLGQQGSDETEEFLGEHIPDWMKASLPLSVLGIEGGEKDPKDPFKRVGVVSTAGLNPYAAIPGILDAVGSVAGVPGTRPNEAVAGQVNPLLTGFMEWTTGRSVLSGAPVDRSRGGWAGAVAQRAIGDTPWARLIQLSVQGVPAPKLDEKGRVRSPLLFKGDHEQHISSLLGVPIKRFSPNKAAELYRREKGIKLPPKSRPRKYQPPRLTAFERTINEVIRTQAGLPRKPSPRRGFSGKNYQPKRYLPKINLG